MFSENSMWQLNGGNEVLKEETLSHHITSVSNVSLCVAETVQQCRALAALEENRGWIPAPMMSVLKLYATPVPGC